MDDVIYTDHVEVVDVPMPADVAPDAVDPGAVDPAVDAEDAYLLDLYERQLEAEQQAFDGEPVPDPAAEHAAEQTNQILNSIVDDVAEFTDDERQQVWEHARNLFQKATERGLPYTDQVAADVMARAAQDVAGANEQKLLHDVIDGYSKTLGRVNHDEVIANARTLVSAMIGERRQQIIDGHVSLEQIASMAMYDATAQAAGMPAADDNVQAAVARLMKSGSFTEPDNGVHHDLIRDSDVRDALGRWKSRSERGQ